MQKIHLWLKGRYLSAREGEREREREGGSNK